MTEDELWTLLEGARRDGGGVLADQVRLLREFFLERGSTGSCGVRGFGRSAGVAAPGPG